MGDCGTTSATSSLNLGGKRTRSWEVDVSLDDLVEWDALETFMSDLPSSEPAASHEGRLGGGAMGGLAGSASAVKLAPIAGAGATTSRMGSADSLQSHMVGGLAAMPVQGTLPILAPSPSDMGMLGAPGCLPQFVSAHGAPGGAASCNACWPSAGSSAGPLCGPATM